jgi:hypothetical protein
VSHRRHTAPSPWLASRAAARRGWPTIALAGLSRAPPPARRGLSDADAAGRALPRPPHARTSALRCHRRRWAQENVGPENATKNVDEKMLTTFLNVVTFPKNVATFLFNSHDVRWMEISNFRWAWMG